MGSKRQLSHYELFLGPWLRNALERHRGRKPRDKGGSETVPVEPDRPRSGAGGAEAPLEFDQP